jgi:hypothetical protein
MRNTLFRSTCLPAALLALVLAPAYTRGEGKPPATEPARLDLALADVRWQTLPDAVECAFVAPDQRVWYQVDPAPVQVRRGEYDAAPIKAIVEREFHRHQPQITGARPVLFERGDGGRLARVWFLCRFPHRLLGWDGKTWVEYDPNADHPERQGPDRRYLRGDLAGHGARGYVSPNLQVGHTLLFSTTDGVTAYDTRRRTFSHQLMSGKDPSNGMPIIPELMASGDGKRAIALVRGPDPALWEFESGRWTKLPAPWPVKPAPPRRIVLTERGVWTIAEKRLRFYAFHGHAPQGFDSMVEALGSGNFERREAAQRAILAMGVSALPWLEKAKKQNEEDVEISLRIQAVLRQLEGTDRPAVGTEAVDFIDSVNAIDRRYVVVVAHDATVMAGRSRYRYFMTDEQGGFTELDASLGKGLQTAYAQLPGSVRTRTPGQYWIPRAGEGGRTALVDVRARKVIDTLPNPRYQWVQAVTADGTVFASPTGPSELATSKPVAVYRAGLRDVTAALPVVSVASTSEAFCVASDGAVWAALASGGVSRFAADAWTPAADLAGMKDVIGFSPGAHGEMLIESRGGAALVIPGRATIFAATAETLVKANRAIVAAAFPQGQCGRPSDGMSGLFADPAGNIWFKRGGPWGVLTRDGWQDGTKASAAASGKKFRFHKFDPIGDGSRVILSEGNYPNGFTFVARVEKRKLVLEKTAHVPHPGATEPFVRDPDGNIYLPGDAVRRVTPDAVLEEVTGLPAGAIPEFADADGNLWLSNRRTPLASELGLWRDGKVRQTISFPGIGHLLSLKADKPGSVWAWNVTGLHHLVAKNGIYALAQSYTVDVTGGISRHTEYTPQGYLVGMSAEADGGVGPLRYRLNLVRLPK